MTKKTNNPISRTAALINNSKAIRGLKGVFVVFFAIITIFGLVTFPQFLFEESFQCGQFGTWAAISAKNWPLVMEGVEIMTEINELSKKVNRTAGWINPLSNLSYRSYTKASDYYIKALSARVFANDPSLFIGRKVTFSFTPNKTENLANGNFRFSNGRLSVISDGRLSVISNGRLSTIGDATSRVNTSNKISVTGILQEKNGRLEIDMTKNHNN